VTLDAGHCITCGDAAAAATVVRVSGVTVTFELAGATEDIGIELVMPVAVGDVLLCHAGIALDKLAPAQ